MGLNSLLKNRPLLAGAVAAGVAAIGAAAIEFAPRRAQAAARLKPPAGAPVSLAASDDVLRIAAWRLRHGMFRDAFQAGEGVELAAYGDAKTGEAPARLTVTAQRARLDAAVAQLRSAVRTAEEGGLLAFHATSLRAADARAIAAAVAEAFAAFAAWESRERAAGEAARFLARQDATLAALVEVERKIAALTPELVPKELLELRKPDLASALGRLAELQSRLAEAESEHRDLSSKINDPNFTFPVDVDEDPSVQACLAEVLKSQVRVNELESRGGSGSAETKEARAQLSNWNTQLAATRAAAVGTLSAKARIRAVDRIRTLGEQRDQLKLESDSLEARITKERQDWEALVQTRVRAARGADSPELTTLNAESRALRSQFTKTLSARLAAEFEATATPKPVPLTGAATDLDPAGWPRSLLYPVTAAVALLAAALAWRAPRPAPRSLRTEQDLARALHIPVLGSTPRAASQKELLLFHIDPRHPFVEAYNTLAALLESYAADHAARTFMVTSATDGEGKSSLAVNLGIALARSGQRVVLIDADFRRSRLHDLLGLPNDRGVSEAFVDASGQPVIVEVDAVLKDTSEPNLRCIPAGPPPQNPVALLKGSAFKALLAETQQKADFIFVDAPSVLSAVDPLLLTPMSDGIVFVAAAGGPRRHDVIYAKKLLENTHGRFAGAVLTQAGAEAREFEEEKVAAPKAAAE
jgi:capsular exopolysaccharide synthesis family protein